MARYLNESDYQHGSKVRLGIMLSNLGTPDSPTTGDVRRYLAEFLRDPRVVEVPRLIWLVVLHGVILRIRPSRSAAAYRKVWGAEGSPLLHISRKQRDGLARRLRASLGDRCEVVLAMRYGNPSIVSVLEALRAKNVRRLLVLPLYPQYSATTTASTFDEVTRILRRWRWLPELRFINQYHDEDGYVGAIAASIESHWQQHGRGERLLFSFHGIPRRYLDNGDPYHCQCHKTARLVAAKLSLQDDAWQLSFQSRLGREEWLRPYTDEVLTSWGGEALKRVDVVCPGFSADCLETLEEVAIQYRELFVEKGGGELRYIEALNSRDDHLDFLAGLVERHCQGWPDSGARGVTEPADTVRLARAMGAER